MEMRYGVTIFTGSVASEQDYYVGETDGENKKKINNK